MTETIIEKFSLKKFIGDDKPLESHRIVPGENDFFGIESQSITDYSLIVPYRSINLEFLSMKHNKQCLLLNTSKYRTPNTIAQIRVRDDYLSIQGREVEKHYSLPQFAVFSLD